VEHLAGLVDEVELLFLESDEKCGLPPVAEISEISAYAKPSGLKLDVHLPLDIDVAAADGDVRGRAHATIHRVLELSAPLAAETFILHVPRRAADDQAAWRTRVEETLSALPAPHAQFAVETLDYDLREIADILRQLGFSACIDIGHLLAGGREVAPVFAAFRGSISMIHLHGVHGQKDHLPLTALDRRSLADIGSILREERYNRSLSLEVFSLEGYVASLPALEEMMPW
jgi:sugar phosphate isomerase/epimerase